MHLGIELATKPSYQVHEVRCQPKVYITIVWRLPQHHKPCVEKGKKSGGGREQVNRIIVMGDVVVVVFAHLDFN